VVGGALGARGGGGGGMGGEAGTVYTNDLIVSRDSVDL
jgi:hypothetical protein